MLTINWDNVKSPSTLQMDGRDISPFSDVRNIPRYVATQRFAWPGGYELFVVTADGGALCPDCVRENYRQVYAETIADNPPSGTGWKVSACDCVANVDDDLFCDHCARNLNEPAQAALRQNGERP